MSLLWETGNLLRRNKVLSNFPVMANTTFSEEVTG